MSYSETAALNAIFGILGTFWLLVVAYFVISIIANWKIFTKAGQPGWAAIVPFYKQYIEFKIYWGNGWLFLVPIVLAALAFVPLLGQLLILANLVITIVTQYKKAVSFGKGVGFTIGLVLVNPIFNMILGFGQYQYLGVPQDGYSYDQLKTSTMSARPRQLTPRLSTPSRRRIISRIRMSATKTPIRSLSISSLSSRCTLSRVTSKLRNSLHSRSRLRFSRRIATA